jgi:thioredoxin reductase
MHGFLTRDGIAPSELLRIGQEQLRAYPSVETRDVEVTGIEICFPETGGCASPDPLARFELTLAGSQKINARKILVATGVVDELPKLIGIEQFYGVSVFHCPYCDGFEVRDKPLAAYGSGESGSELAMTLQNWSDTVSLCSDNPAGIRDEQREKLEALGVHVFAQKIATLSGVNGQLHQILFDDGAVLPCHALFFTTPKFQHSDLCAKLGCTFTDKGFVATGKYQASNVPGVYVAGDAAGSMQLAIVAAAEGTQAAVAINMDLMEEERQLALKPHDVATISR